MFAALVEFAYTGDYERSIPSTARRLLDAGEDQAYSRGQWGSLKEKKKHREFGSGVSMGSKLWQSFLQLKPVQTSVDNLQQTRKATGAHELLYHAEVCTAATRYLMDTVQALSLSKLHEHLCSLAPKPDEIPVFLDLLQYVYTGSDVDSVPQLRKMVLAYAAAKMNLLAEDKRFRSLMQDVAKIGTDLVYEVSSAGHWT